MKIVWNNGKQPDSSNSHNSSDASPSSSNHAKPKNLSGTWLDEVVEAHQQEGGFEDLPGKGKPLALKDESFDSLVNGILKNADALPEWVVLHKEIRGEILNAINRLDDWSSVNLDSINDKVKRYNRLCPSPLLQKPLLSLDNIRTHASRWE